MSEDIEARMRELAEDLAADTGQTVESAVAALQSALNGSAEPINHLFLSAARYQPIPWWKRIIPGWRLRLQRRTLEDIEKEMVG